VGSHWVRSFFVVVLFVALAGGLFWWYKSRDVESYFSLSAAARYDNWFALDSLLVHEGVSVSRSRRLVDVLKDVSVDDVLFIYGNRFDMTVAHFEQVKNWVSQGGRVFLFAWRDDDVWLKALGVGKSFVEVVENEEDVDVLRWDQRVPWGGDVCLSSDSVQFVEGGQDVSVFFPHLSRDSFLSFESAVLKPVRFLGHASGAQFLQFGFGEGQLFVVNSNYGGFSNLWGNSYLGCFDNAFLFLSLIEGSSHVWFVSANEFASWLQLLWKNFPLLIILLVSFVFLWCWLRGFRFGPLVCIQDVGVRRSLLEHVRAGQWFWGAY